MLRANRALHTTLMVMYDESNLRNDAYTYCDNQRIVLYHSLASR